MGTLTASRARRLYLAKTDEPTDQLSMELQQRIQQKWKADIRRLPPGQRAHWLRSNAEAIAGLGAARCRDLLRNLDDLQVAFSRTSPSEPWMNDRWNEAADLPAMPVSRFATQMGIAGVIHGHEAIATCRPTPAPALFVEELLDSKSKKEADEYHHSASISAVVIEKIRWLKATESKGRRRAAQRRREPSTTPDYANQCEFLSFDSFEQMPGIGGR